MFHNEYCNFLKKIYTSVKRYITEDKARWLLDRNNEFLGKINNQFKLRGFRVELGERVDYITIKK